MAQPTPTSDAVLYITNLDPNITLQNVKDFFSQYHLTVKSESKISTDSTTGKSRGYGYLHFTSAEEAQKALSEYNNQCIPPSLMPYRLEQYNKTITEQRIMMKQLPPSVTEASLKELLTPYGPVSDVSIHPSENRATAVVTFQTKEGADLAISNLHHKPYPVSSGSTEPPTEVLIEVERYKTKAQRNSAEQCRLDIDNLPQEAQDSDLRRWFEPFGTIVECRVLRNAQGISTQRGYCQYTTAGAARAAQINLNETRPAILMHKRVEFPKEDGTLGHTMEEQSVEVDDPILVDFPHPKKPTVQHKSQPKQPRQATPQEMLEYIQRTDPKQFEQLYAAYQYQQQLQMQAQIQAQQAELFPRLMQIASKYYDPNTAYYLVMYVINTNPIEKIRCLIDNEDQLVAVFRTVPLRPFYPNYPPY